jgi:phenylpropionate dioxygenase-like ring-hydroxylating dioxygenase large terminal subunit
MKNAERGVDVNALLRLDEGLVHSDVYTSPEVFDLEMEKIYHRGWVYVGHESEIPQPGDYVLRWIGTQTVIMSRDDNGKLHLFMNRCRHRANSVCQFEKGNSSFFRCAYHGWTYGNTGDLVGVPYKEGAYSPDFKKEDFPLISPRMEIYRGFIWGNLSQSGISLDEHLGPAGKKAIDHFCDASPEGEIILRQGCLKGLIYANWKFQGGDGYHPPFTHQANFMYMRGKREGNRRNPLTINGQFEEGFRSRDLGHGHYSLDLRSIGRDRLPDTSWAREYRESMIKAYGKERGEFLIRTGGNPHTIFMPNMHLINHDVRVLRPIAVDQFEIYFYCAFLKGVPHEVNELRMRDTEDRMGPSGSINPDDVDMFERNQFGMQQIVHPWKFMARGMDREQVDDDLGTPEAYRMTGTLAGHYSDEVTQRAQLRWWAAHLSQP